MTNDTQKKQYTQNTTPKMMGLNARTKLRAGFSFDDFDLNKLFPFLADKGASGQQASSNNTPQPKS